LFMSCSSFREGEVTRPGPHREAAVPGSLEGFPRPGGAARKNVRPAERRVAGAAVPAAFLAKTGRAARLAQVV